MGFVSGRADRTPLSFANDRPVRNARIGHALQRAAGEVADGVSRNALSPGSTESAFPGAARKEDFYTRGYSGEGAGNRGSVDPGGSAN